MFACAVGHLWARACVRWTSGRATRAQRLFLSPPCQSPELHVSCRTENTCDLFTGFLKCAYLHVLTSHLSQCKGPSPVNACVCGFVLFFSHRKWVFGEKETGRKHSEESFFSFLSFSSFHKTDHVSHVHVQEIKALTVT